MTAWRDREGWPNVVFCDDGWVVDKKERDGGCRWEWHGGYEGIWEIRGTTCFIGFRRPRICDITLRIGTCTCHFGDGKFTHTRNSLKSQFLMMISPISSDLSLSCAQLYHHLRTRSWVIPPDLSMPWSWVNTEYSIQQVHHHAKIHCLLLPASFSSVGGCCCTQLSSFPQSQVNQWIESQLLLCLPPNQPTPSTPPISLDHSLQVHVQTRSITASMCTSNLARSRPPSASVSSLNLGLQVHLQTHRITSSQCISKLAQSRPHSGSLSSLNLSLQLHLQPRSVVASQFISILARSRPRSASLSSLDPGLQLHRQTCSITASMYTCKQQRRLYGDTGVTEVEWASGSIYSGHPRVHRHHPILSYNNNTHSICPNFWSHSLFPRFRGSMPLHGSSRPGSIISSHLRHTSLELELLFATNSVRMSREVWYNIVGLSDFQLCRFTTTASKWCISTSSQWVSPGAPPIMLDHHLWPDWRYVYI